MELISPLLRTDFREFCVTYFVLRQINDIFTMAGIKRGSIQPDRMISGQRRTLVEEYYASTNWEREEDAEQFLKVLGYAIAQQYSGSDEPRQKLRMFCEREGLLVDGIHVSFRSNAPKIPKRAAVGSATLAKLKIGATANMKTESAKSTEPASENFYLYADLGSDPTLSSDTVFYRVTGEQSAQILCRLFQKEYHADESNPSFFLKAVDEVEPDGQILLDEALDWLDIYDDPDRFVYDPPPSKETMIRAQYAQRARKWEAVIMTRTNEANTSRKPEIDQTTEKAHDRLRRVWVVHGRDERLRKGVFTFLRSLGLEPLEFSEARQLTKKPSPYIGEILDVAFAHAQAVVVLLTPDDQVQLRPDLLNPGDPPYEGTLTGQARPNVIFEGGMAWVSHRERTLFIQIGSVKPFSDVSGLHILRLNNNTDKRQDFAHRLRDAGCPVNMSGADWHTAGDLAPGEAGGGSQPEVPSSGASRPPAGDAYPTPDGNKRDVSHGPATAAKAARITHEQGFLPVTEEAFTVTLTSGYDRGFLLLVESQADQEFTIVGAAAHWNGLDLGPVNRLPSGEAWVVPSKGRQQIRWSDDILLVSTLIDLKGQLRGTFSELINFTFQCVVSGVQYTFRKKMKVQVDAVNRRMTQI